MKRPHHLILVKEQLALVMEKCYQQAYIYHDYGYEGLVPNRMMEQIYMDKLRMLQGMEHVFHLMDGDEWCPGELLHKNEQKKSRQPIMECLFEEVEYINELQTVYYEINSLSWRNEISSVLQIQHQIVYRLLMLNDMERAL